MSVDRGSYRNLLCSLERSREGRRGAKRGNAREDGTVFALGWDEGITHGGRARGRGRRTGGKGRAGGGGKRLDEWRRRLLVVVVVVVAFSWTHSTARVSRGYGINASARGAQGERRSRVRFAKSAIKRIAYGGEVATVAFVLMSFVIAGGRRRDTRKLPLTSVFENL